METAAHPRFLFKRRSLGTLFGDSTSFSSAGAGVVKTFRWTTQISQMDAALDTVTERLFASAVGCVLTGLTRDQYSFNGEPCHKNAGSLQLQFAASIVTLKLRGDGQSVTADSNAIEITSAFSLDSESHCSWALVDLFNSSPWSQLRDQTLRAVDAIIDTWADDGSCVMGWMLSFDRHHICYVNWGDDSRILFNETPPFEAHDSIRTSTCRIAAV